MRRTLRPSFHLREEVFGFIDYQCMKKAERGDSELHAGMTNTRRCPRTGQAKPRKIDALKRRGTKVAV